MSWEVILGTDQRFAEFVEWWQRPHVSFSQGDDYDDGAVYDTFNPANNRERWDCYLLFRNEELRYTLCYGGGRSVKFLSAVDASSEIETISLLGLEYHGVRELNVHYRLHVIELPDHDEAVLSFMLDTQGFCRDGHCNLYVDVPLELLYWWARQFEETILRRFPFARFPSRLGLCSRCGDTLRLHEYDRGWWGPYLCDSCNAWKEAEEIYKEERERKRQKASVRKKNLRDGRRVILRCTVCTRKFERTASSVKGVQYLCCGDACATYLQNTVIAERKRLYTSAFLRMLLEHEYDACAFPGCPNQKAPPAPSNPWNVCAAHLRRVKSALYHQRRKREALLLAEGIDPMKGGEYECTNS